MADPTEVSRLGAMADITQITSQLWTGGAITTVESVGQIAASGIVADIDCREEFDDQSLIDSYNNLPPTPQALKDHPHLAYYFAGVPDDGLPKPVIWFEGVWNFARPILMSYGAVLAHCAAGVNRGPSMCYFLMRAFGKLGGDEAYALLKQQRPMINTAYRADADQAIITLGLG